MTKCSYCGKEYEPYLGINVVDSVTGHIRSYCSGKCRKYSVMKRKKGKWFLELYRWGIFAFIEELGLAGRVRRRSSLKVQITKSAL
jgi:ribosomal protein L24E